MLRPGPCPYRKESIINTDSINLALRSHIYILLDRSGSMASMVDDVIGGFNQLVAEQQAQGGDARITLVQFDSQDPHEVLIDGKRIHRARPLTRDTFVPRGGTPLLDATGRLIAKAVVRQGDRKLLGKIVEDITFITITDGHENQSREYTRDVILRLVEGKRAEGWAFVFLGAGLDAYAEARTMGYDARSVQAFKADGAGAGLAFSSTSASLRAKRRARATGAPVVTEDFFQGNKVAEEDRKRRGN